MFDIQYLNFAFGDDIRAFLFALKILVYVITTFITIAGIGYIIEGIKQ